MDKESLKIVQKKVIDLLNDCDINIVDKVELLINLKTFLDVNKYDNNIKILSKKTIDNNKKK